MSQSNQPSEPIKGKQTVNNVALFSVGAEVGCATLIIVFLSLFVGIGLDKLLGTKPVFIILFTLGSAPLSIFITYKLAMRAVKSATHQVPEAKQVKSVEEEDKSE
jgi:F0F1-type ATP synthase assembly protein I